MLKCSNGISLNIQLIKNYFNDKADIWDDNVIFNIDTLNKLFDKGSFFTNSNILDVGCGTGVLFDYYKNNNANSITGIDISSRMIEIAKKKYSDVDLICDDVISHHFNKMFDVIVIFDALPHIYSVEALLENCKRYLNCNGKLIIAFDKNRDVINTIHQSVPEGVSNQLLPIEDLKDICSRYFSVDYYLANDELYEIICVNRTQYGKS